MASPGFRDCRHRSLPMAPYHIRKYQESDNESVLALFSSGLAEHIPATFRHMLMLPRILLFLLGVPLTLLLVTGSWLLTIMSTFTLLVFLRLLANFPWKIHEALCLRTDLADITKSYMSTCGSCYWVAESEGKVVGTVSALPVADPPLGKKQLQLLHLSVAVEHRGLIDNHSASSARSGSQKLWHPGHMHSPYLFTLAQSAANAQFQNCFLWGSETLSHYLVINNELEVLPLQMKRLQK